MVHLVRNSLKDVNDKQRAEVAKDLKTMYLEVCAEKWDKQYAAIRTVWRAHWEHVIPAALELPGRDP